MRDFTKMPSDPVPPGLPEKYIEFAKEVGALAIKYQLNTMHIGITPGFDFNEKWREPISISWMSGRHGEDEHKIKITSNVNMGITLTAKADPR